MVGFVDLLSGSRMKTCNQQGGEHALFLVVHPDATATLHSSIMAATFDSLFMVCGKRCNLRVPRKT